MQIAYIKQEQKLAMIEQTQRSASALRPLLQVADNQEAFVRYTDLIALARGAPSSSILVANKSGDFSFGAQQWILRRINGKYFVYGWRFTNAYTTKHRYYRGVFASLGAHSDVQEPYNIPVGAFKNITTLPRAADGSSGAGEEVTLPDMPM